MAGWYLFKTDRKNSIRIMVFILTVVMVSLLIRLIFPSIDHATLEQRKVQALPKYPLIIAALGLQKKYDIAKWTLYCIYCDDTVKLRKIRTDTAITYGNMELSFSRLEKHHDSLELNFYFYLGNTRCDFETVETVGDKFFTNGVLFIKDSLAAYTTPTSMRYFWQGGLRNRFFRPLQPEVIVFIKNNKDKLNPWFREEAQRRNIIE
jgi:hypothetical protein